MGKGQAEEYQGKSLDEIDLHLEEELLGNNNDDNPAEISDIDDHYAHLLQKKRRCLVPWTEEQNKLVKEFFKHHKEDKKLPKRNECETLISQQTAALHNKSCLKIKVFVQNIYTNKQKA
ncbi:hypothetical protein ILUMI_03470 [Ignelater luminosus]|uniref:Uncharacterized protein n=1 Tax=Ignelater luminosus TaxID=2038154 RepID=A0A8K0DGA0_IGNLU|nr:hypothetical protein ILUMI_03470 [Ignelater luminosus]